MSSRCGTHTRPTDVPRSHPNLPGPLYPHIWPPGLLGAPQHRDCVGHQGMGGRHSQDRKVLCCRGPGSGLNSEQMVGLAIHLLAGPRPPAPALATAPAQPRLQPPSPISGPSLGPSPSPSPARAPGPMQPWVSCPDSTHDSEAGSTVQLPGLTHASAQAISRASSPLRAGCGPASCVGRQGQGWPCESRPSLLSDTGAAVLYLPCLPSSSWAPLSGAPCPLLRTRTRLTVA